MSDENTQFPVLKNLGAFIKVFCQSVRDAYKAADDSMQRKIIQSVLVLSIGSILAFSILFSSVIAFLIKLILLAAGYFLVSKYLLPSIKESFYYIKHFKVRPVVEPVETKE